jgi:hypothetical protein
MAARFELRHLTAALIFDLEDGYARRRGVRGLHPRPIGPLVYRLLGRAQDGGTERFEPPLDLRVRRNPSGFDLFFGLVELPDGTRRTLADGVYALRISSPYQYYQPVELENIALPRPDTPFSVDLEPAAGYPFPTETLPRFRGPTLLRGVYAGRDGAGIAGATVQVPGVSTICVTDHIGQWVLVFPDDQPTGNVTVRFQASDGTVENVPGVLVLGGQEASLRQTALRGWTLATTGAPLAGASVAVSGQPAPVRSRPDGSWSYYFPLSQQATTVSVTASLPDGRAQTHPNIPVEPRATNVVPTFRL